MNRPGFFSYDIESQIFFDLDKADSPRGQKIIIHNGKTLWHLFQAGKLTLRFIQQAVCGLGIL